VSRGYCTARTDWPARFVSCVSVGEKRLGSRHLRWFADGTRGRVVFGSVRAPDMMWLKAIRERVIGEHVEEDDDGVEVVVPTVERTILDRFPEGFRWIDVAAELWGLVDPAHATEIAGLRRHVTRGNDHREIRVANADVARLAALIDDIAPRLRGRYVDDQMNYDESLLPTLRAALPSAADRLSPKRPRADRAQAMAELIVSVESMQRFLREAAEQGADVVLGD